MDRSTRLIPSQVIEQSNSAITKLQLDNEHLRTARTAKDAFINDNTVYSTGINNLNAFSRA